MPVPPHSLHLPTRGQVRDGCNVRSRIKWPYLVLLTELLVFYLHVLFRPATYVIPWDFQYYAFNQASFLAASLRAGHFPLWDPYTYCGTPFYTNIQSQVFYPPTLLMVF